MSESVNRSEQGVVQGSGGEKRHQPYVPGEPDLSGAGPKENILKRFWKTRLSKKKLAAAAVVTAGAASVAGTFLGEVTVGKGNENTNTGENTGSENVVTVELTPALKTPSGETIIPGTNVAVPTISTETPRPVETAAPAENPLFARYDSIAAKINASEASSGVKSELLTQLEGYKTIELVQDQLMKAYLSELGPDGTPALLYYSWPKVPGVSQESQMFVLINQNKVESGLRAKIDLLAGNFEAVKAQEVFAEINRGLTENPGSGNGLYVGIDLSPSEYKFLADPRQAPEVTFSNVSEEQKAQVLNLLNTKYATLKGSFEIRGISSGTSVTNNLEGKTVISINFADKLALNHELAHALNLSQDVNAVPVEDFVHSAVLAEKALFDANYGRQHSSLEQMGKGLDQVAPGMPAFSDSGLDRFMHNFANSENPNGMFGDGARKFALDRSGVGITNEKIAEVTKTRSGDTKVFYDNLDAFLNGERETLDKLSAMSEYWEMKVGWLRGHPKEFENLAAKLSGIQITHPSGKEKLSYYKYLAEGTDPVFAVMLVNGDARALDYLNSLDTTNRSLLLNDSVARLQTADFETWATMSTWGVIREGQNAYANYVSYYLGLREAFGKVLK